jgi:tetratricopeptide (TPR) repeat protein
MTLLKSRKEPAVAMAEALGRIEEYEEPFVSYINRSILSFARLNVDATVKREGFSIRPVPPADAAAARASFHAAMRRPNEARALLAEARKAQPEAAAAYVTDGLLLDAETRYDEARIAYAKAAELGSQNAYAFYRWASLSWGQNLVQETLAAIEKSLMRAVELNPRYANAIAFLAQTRLAMGKPAPDTVPLARQAIELEPGEPYHHLVASRIYLRLRSFAAARGEARAALALPATDDERREAEELLQLIDRAEKAGGSPPDAAR